MIRRRRSLGALTLVLAGTLAISLGTSTAAIAAPDFPTWDDVNNARQNEAATKAKISEIESILSALETEAADLGRIAQVKGEEYNIARDALDAASSKADSLKKQADSAQEQAALSSQRAGQLLAQLARTGSGDMTMSLLLSTDASDLLNKLGTMSKLTEQAGVVYQQAILDQNSAKALTEQAQIAKKERTGLAATAQSALAEAQAAAAAAQARVDQQQAASDQMYAQLAALKGTTASVEQGYLDGVAWEKAQEAIKNPPPVAPPVNPTPPPPSGSLVDGAIAFAYAQLGKPYRLGGAGPNYWDCSGLTKYSYASVGVNIGTHSATNQYNVMANAGRLVPLNQMVAGDLLWYSDGGSTWGDKYHVTLYIGNGQMIEAPYEGQPVRIRPVRYGDLVPYAGRPTP